MERIYINNRNTVTVKEIIIFIKYKIKKLLRQIDIKNFNFI